MKKLSTVKITILCRDRPFFRIPSSWSPYYLNFNILIFITLIFWVVLKCSHLKSNKIELRTNLHILSLDIFEKPLSSLTDSEYEIVFFIDRRFQVWVHKGEAGDGVRNNGEGLRRSRQKKRYFHLYFSLKWLEFNNCYTKWTYVVCLVKNWAVLKKLMDLMSPKHFGNDLITPMACSRVKTDTVL